MNLSDFNKILKNKDYHLLDKLCPNYMGGNIVIELDDFTVFFKPKQKNTYSNLMEIFISKFLGQKFDVAKTEYAKINNFEGSVSYDILQKQWTFFDYDAFLKKATENYVSFLPFHEKTSYNYLSKKLDNLIFLDKNFTLENKKILLKQFLERMIVSNFFMNTDDHAQNHKLITNNKQFVFAPLFDNSSFMLGDYNFKEIKDNILNNTLTKFLKEKQENIKTYATLDGEIESVKNANENLLKIQRQFPKFYEKTLKKISQLNLEKALGEMEESFDFDKDFSILVKEIFNLRKNQFLLNQNTSKTVKEEKTF